MTKEKLIGKSCSQVQDSPGSSSSIVKSPSTLIRDLINSSYAFYDVTTSSPPTPPKIPRILAGIYADWDVVKHSSETAIDAESILQDKEEDTPGSSTYVAGWEI